MVERRDCHALFLRENFKPAIAQLIAIVLLTATAIVLICIPQGYHSPNSDIYNPMMFNYVTVILHLFVFFVLPPTGFQGSEPILMGSWFAFVLVVYLHRYSNSLEVAALRESLLRFGVHISLDTLGMVIRMLARDWILTVESLRWEKRIRNGSIFRSSHTLRLSNSSSSQDSRISIALRMSTYGGGWDWGLYLMLGQAKWNVVQSCNLVRRGFGVAANIAMAL